MGDEKNTDALEDVDGGASAPMLGDSQNEEDESLEGVSGGPVNVSPTTRGESEDLADVSGGGSGDE